MIDLHCHILPGIDDGPGSVGDSVQMARAAVDAGTTTIACTPHMHPRYPTSPGVVHDGVRDLQGRLDTLDVPLRLVPGGEVSLDWLPRMDDAALGMARLGDGGHLLVEMPFGGWPLRLAETLRDLEMRGFGVILAHPERAAAVQRAPDRMRDIVGRGALVQVTAGSLTGEHGPDARRAAETLLRGGLVHFLASDAHSAGPWRPPGLGDGLEAAARVLRTEPDALRWMVDEGPRAVIEGRPVRPPQLTPSRTPRADAGPASGAPRSPTRG
ncbi:MAG: tyrosine-protein phosphatase [Thermoleophilia bacterium]